MTTPHQRQEASTRGFCTTDPERQGLTFSVARIYLKPAATVPAELRAQRPQYVLGGRGGIQVHRTSTTR